jgi:hypothetical protein
MRAYAATGDHPLSPGDHQHTARLHHRTHCLGSRPRSPPHPGPGPCLLWSIHCIITDQAGGPRAQNGDTPSFPPSLSPPRQDSQDTIVESQPPVSTTCNATPPSSPPCPHLSEGASPNHSPARGIAPYLGCIFLVLQTIGGLVFSEGYVRPPTRHRPTE